MYRKRSFLPIVVAVVLLIFIGFGVSSLYRAGVSQGILLGYTMANAGQSGTQPGAPVWPFYQGYGFPGYGFHGFFPFGPLIGLLFFGGFLFLLFGLFRRRAWGCWNDPDQMKTHAKWRKGRHAGPPPWARGQEGAGSESPGRTGQEYSDNPQQYPIDEDEDATWL